jgi:trimethylamine---corrinoid protein Co-methyltransferase
MSENRRKGGRERRDPNAKINGPAYIKRGIPTYDILSEEGLQKIEASAERILAEVGLDIRDDDECLALFRKAGAKVDGLRVRFEPGHVREILKTAPQEFIQHARNPKHNVSIGGKSVVFAPAYGAPFVMDLDKGRRYGTLEDFQNFVKLTYASPWLHHSGGTVCEPTDIPVNKRHLDMVYAHMRYSEKPFMGSVTAEDRAEDSIEMSRILFGKDFVDQNCVILGNVNVNSPLLWDGTMTKSARAYARANQAAVIVPFILGGAMGPVTNAGAIAQALAETMVGCAITQLERPGAPVIFGNFMSSMSLRSGSPTFGTPEPALGSLAIGQLARRLGLPLRCAGSFTTAKVPDGQAMQESVTSMLSAIHCGANSILHSAGFLDGLLSMSYEKFMMDADFCGALHSYLAGITIDDNALAFDAYSEVNPAGHFLGCAHTMANYTTAFFDSTISDNTPFESWNENGKTDSATRANARWKAALSEYVAPTMDVAVDEALLDFMARRKASMADQWY